MASLEELKKRLYKKEETFSERTVEPDLRQPPSYSGNVYKAPTEVIPRLETAVKFFTPSRKRWIIGGIVAVIIFLGALFFARSLFVNIQAVDVKIAGTDAIKSGERLTWRVEIANRTNKTLKDASLVFTFPEGAVPLNPPKTPGLLRERRSVADIRAGESIVESFDADIFGGRGMEKKVSALLEYRPDGTSAVFVKENAFSFSIAQSPVSISLVMPDELRIGQEADIEVHYTSQSDQPISDLVVRAVFPEDFEYVSSRPASSFAKASADKQVKQQFEWSVGTLKPSEEGVVAIRGIVRGANLESKSFRASIGILQAESIGTAGKKFLSYDEVLKTVVLRSPFLEIGLSVRGEKSVIAVAGETISVTVDWKNNLSEELRNISLEASVDGPFVDLASIRAEKGLYSEAKRAIVWNSGTYDKFSRVAPDASDTVSFSFQIKNNITLDASAVRPAIKIKATLKPGGSVSGFEGVDISGSTSLDVKIASKLQLASRALYFNAPFSNAGVLPPKVGEETTYTVIWSLANTANDVDGVTVSSTLPPYMSFKNIVSPADADISFDQNTGRVEWRPGRVPAGTGFVRPALQIAFQVGLIPSLSQVNTSPTIIGETEATGRDTFTSKMVSSKSGLIGTDLPDDPNVSFSQKRVVQ